MLPLEPDERWQLASQLGVTHAVTRLSTPPTDADETGDGSQNAAPWEFQPLLHMQQRFEDAEFKLQAIEDIYLPLIRVRSGDTLSQGVEEMRTLVENMGASISPCSAIVDGVFQLVPDLHECSHMRLHSHSPRRSTCFPTPQRRSNHYQPRSRGTRLRALSKPRKRLDILPGPFSAVNKDIPAMIHRFADHTQYVHFRDVAGTRSTFTEAWHDAGPTDILGVMQAYNKIGFDRLMRPDHC